MADSFKEASQGAVLVGIVAKEQGLTITRAGFDDKPQIIEANAGDKIYKGDVLKTDERGGTARIELVDKTILSLGAGYVVKASDFAAPPTMLDEEHKKGVLNTINTKPSSYKPAVTPITFSMSGGVRG